MARFFKWYMAFGLVFSFGIAGYTVFGPREKFSVRREIMIRRDAAAIFPYLADLKRQPEYNYYNLTIPDLRFEAQADRDGEVRQAWWDSEKTKRAARVTDLVVVKNRLVRYIVRLDGGPFETALHGRCDLKAVERNQTLISCSLTADLRMAEKMFVPDFQSDNNLADPLADSLMNLKLLLEK